MGNKEERVMRIGMVGAGAQGGTLAKQLAKAGHEVRVANRRGPQSLQEFAKQTGTIASTVEDAATHAEVIMIALPFKDIPSLPKPLFKDLPDSVTIVDVSNYYPSWRDGPIPEVEADPAESEWVERQIGRPVVKAFNSITSDSLQNLGEPVGSSDRIALPLAGDRVEDKKKVAKLINDLGFDELDIGSLSQSWRQQPGTPAYCTDLDLESLSAAVNAADRRTATEKREEQSRAIVALGPNATPLERVKVSSLYFHQPRKREKHMASFASVFPILPGKTEQWKRFCQEMVGPRRSEYEASNKRLGITRDFAALQQTPQGDVTVVYLEAQDIPRVFEGYASSQEPFDVWYREQLKDIHGVDFSQPLPGPLPEVFIDWRAR